MAPELTTYEVAEAMFILARSQDIILALKTTQQRTDAENERVQRGLRKSLLLELVWFVPLSTFIVLATIKNMLPHDWMASPASYGLLGMIAYAFPFMSFKKVVTMWALRSLKGFYDVLSDTQRAELDASLQHQAQAEENQDLERTKLDRPDNGSIDGAGRAKVQTPLPEKAAEAEQGGTVRLVLDLMIVRFAEGCGWLDRVDSCIVHQYVRTCATVESRATSVSARFRANLKDPRPQYFRSCRLQGGTASLNRRFRRRAAGLKMLCKIASLRLYARLEVDWPAATGGVCPFRKVPLGAETGFRC